jgi:hypothetical protein
MNDKSPDKGEKVNAIDGYAIVVHAYYGCDTGCCGHAVETYDRLGRKLERTFDFSHPYGQDDYHEFARSLAAIHAPGFPLRWEECDIRA